MMVQDLGIDGLVLVTPRRFGDDRGWFTESWSARAMAEAGLEYHWVQDNHSFSAQRGTLRGLHYQSPPHAQDKLVRCTRGAVLDVGLDARVGSPTFGAWRAVELSPANGAQLFLPKGFLHGFLTLTEDCEVQYKCTDYYAPEADGSVRWDSAGVDWGFDGTPVLSAKDAAAPAFADWTSPFTMEAA